MKEIVLSIALASSFLICDAATAQTSSTSGPSASSTSSQQGGFKAQRGGGRIAAPECTALTSEPKNLPQIPQPAGGSTFVHGYVSRTPQGSGLTAIYKSGQSSDDIIKFYKTSMVQNGWKIEGGSTATKVVATRNGTSCVIDTKRMGPQTPNGTYAVTFGYK